MSPDAEGEDFDAMVQGLEVEKSANLEINDHQFSVLPKTVWQDVRVEGGFATSLRGLIPHPSAVLSATLARVNCIISDPRTTSLPMTFWALLAAEGDVPLVLGCAGFLDRTKFTLDAPRRRAWLEF